MARSSGEGPAMLLSLFLYEGTSIVKKTDLGVSCNQWQTF